MRASYVRISEVKHRGSSSNHTIYSDLLLVSRCAKYWWLGLQGTGGNVPYERLKTWPRHMQRDTSDSGAHITFLDFHTDVRNPSQTTKKRVSCHLPSIFNDLILGETSNLIPAVHLGLIGIYRFDLSGNAEKTWNDVHVLVRQPGSSAQCSDPPSTAI